jgi:hypothetical protein
MTGPASPPPTARWWDDPKKTALIALVISVVAALATVGQAVYAGIQLAEAKQQFDSSGPLLNYVGGITFTSGLPGQPDFDSDLKKLTIFTKRQFDEAGSAYYYFGIENYGRLETKLSSFYFYTSDRDALSLNDAECTTASGIVTGWSKCDTSEPITLTPGSRIAVRFDLKSHRDQLGHSSRRSTDGYMLTFVATGLREPVVGYDTEFQVEG